jgi:hypothetical protein
VAPVVELGGARRRMARHRLGVFQSAVAFQIIRYAGGAQGVIADFGFDTRLQCAALDHAVGVRLPHALLRAGGAARGEEQRPSLFVGDAGCHAALKSWTVDPMIRVVVHDFTTLCLH